MSVTTVFRRFHEDALKHWVDDREHFDEQGHPECDSIQLGVELLAVADLVARARDRRPRALHKEFLFRFLVGFVGDSVYNDGDYPRIINARDVARAGGMIDRINADDLRGVYDLARLKADHLEIEEYGLWDALGPNVLDAHLIPMFENIKLFFHRATRREQQVVVSWF
jgi:hypothetical protein